jgi:transcriptional regulator with XRE-family HTH domain
MSSVTELYDEPESTLEFLLGELRRARIRANLNQEDYGKLINFSASMVSHVENGRRVLTRDYVRGTDKAFDTDGLFERLFKLAQIDSAPLWLREWITFEQEAVLIRWFEALVIPGLLQTEAYARAVLSWGGLLTEREIERAVTSRMDRQAVLLRDPPPQFIAMMDEGVIHRKFGEPAVMREQADHLLAMGEHPHIHLHIVPSDVGAHVGLAGPFIMAKGPDGRELAHLDTPLQAYVVDRAEAIDSLHRRWECIRTEALPHRASMDLIKEVAKSWT